MIERLSASCPALVSRAQPAETPEPVTIRHAIQPDGADYYMELRDQIQSMYPHITVELDPLGSRELASLDPREYDVLGPHLLFDQLRNRGDLMALDALIEGMRMPTYLTSIPVCSTSTRLLARYGPCPLALNVTSCTSTRTFSTATGFRTPRSGGHWRQERGMIAQ